LTQGPPKNERSTELRRKRNEFNPGDNPNLIRELNRDIGFALGDELRVPLTASELKFGCQLVHDAKSPEYIGNVDAGDAAGSGIGYDDHFGGQ
jgi:hypothetical protein